MSKLPKPFKPIDQRSQVKRAAVVAKFFGWNPDNSHKKKKVKDFIGNQDLSELEEEMETIKKEDKNG
jgi:hypothetical protein